jgi:hypothetical protein
MKQLLAPSVLHVPENQSFTTIKEHKLQVLKIVLRKIFLSNICEVSGKLIA